MFKNEVLPFLFPYLPLSFTSLSCFHSEIWQGTNNPDKIDIISAVHCKSNNLGGCGRQSKICWG
jgi:hypothetical protein